MDELRIWLLGGFRVRVGGHDIPEERWRLRKARSLLKLLALAPGHRLHREELIELLWPELSQEGADNQLRKALHDVRRALDPDPNATFRHIASGDQLCLRPDAWVDVDAFEEAATEARRTRDADGYERALAFYGGDLLPEDRYETWLGVRQDALRAEYLALLVEWARLLEGRADLDRASAALRTVLAVDPLHEEASGALMRIDALAGRRHEALQEYRRIESALRQELHVAPSAPLQHLHATIAAGQAPGGLDSELWEQVGDLRLLSGDASGAGTAFERALRTLAASGLARAARLHRKAAQAWLTDQRPDRATGHLREAEALGSSTDVAEAARRLAVTATWLWQQARYEEAQSTAERGVELARKGSQREALAFTQEALAIVQHLRGAWREGLIAELGRIAAGPDAQLETVSEIYCCIGQYHLYGDGLSESVEAYARMVLELATVGRARRAEAFAWCLLGESLLLQGRWEEAEACLHRSAVVHEEFGPGAGALAWERLAELAACRGDSGAAQDCLRRAMAIATVSPLAHHMWGRLFAVAAFDAVERGEPYGAVRAARAADAAAARYGECAACGVMLHPLAAEGYAALGEPGGAARHARAAWQIAESFDSSSWRAMAESASAAVAQAEGDREEARSRYLTAAAEYERARQPFWAARSRMRAALARSEATSLHRADQRLLDEAAEAFERLGAVRALDRAHASVRSQGAWPPLLPRPRQGQEPVEELAARSGRPATG